MNGAWGSFLGGVIGGFAALLVGYWGGYRRGYRDAMIMVSRTIVHRDTGP